MAAAKSKTLSLLFRSAAAKKRAKAASKLAAQAADSLEKGAISAILFSSNTSSVDSDERLSRQVSSCLHGSSDVLMVKKSDSEEANLNSEENIISLEMVVRMPNIHNRVKVSRELAKASGVHAKISRERKAKWTYKNTENVRFRKLIQTCGARLGAECAVQVFGRLGRETGVKEYNLLILLCIEEAKKSEDEEVSLEHILNAYELLKLMKERGLQIDEETYGPFLRFLIDMRMVDEFFFLLDIIKDEDSSSSSRFGYYEMLLAIEVNDETKIQELSNQIASDGSDWIFALQGCNLDSQCHIEEQFLMALCNRDRKKELLEVLERIDITQISSVENLSQIFSSLGRLSLESFAAQFISQLKDCDQRSQSISMLITDYATSIKYLVVEEAVSKFRSMHAELELVPSSLSCEKLIKFCCNSLEVYEALDVASQMLEAGLTLSVATLNFLLCACEESGEFSLVYQISSMLRCFNLKPDSETYRSMINLCVRLEDFEGAYTMLDELEKVNINPTTNMYNAIMAGFFREKNISCALNVLEKMKAAKIKPDSQTFSYLIGNSDSEEDIIKYYEELKSSGIQVTKHIYMALINAYANSGQFEEAKQVVLDKGIEIKDLNEVKSVLISALATHGRMSDALKIYEDIKLGGHSPEPKAIIALIEHLQSRKELSIMLQLVDQLNDPHYWFDGCCRVIGYCVKNKHLRTIIDLIDEMLNNFNDNIFVIERTLNVMFSYVAEMEPSDVQFGLNLLQALKDDLMLQPTRRCLDFLLSACVSAKDYQSAGLVWEEYRAAGLPYNVLGLLRMYHIFLASGDKLSADKILKQIPMDDPHVRAVIRTCQVTCKKSSKKDKKARKAKKK